MNVLFDTNVLIDAIAKRADFYQDSQNAIVVALTLRFPIYITASQCNDIHYICRKLFKSERQSRDRIRNLLDLSTILDVNSSDIEAALNYEKNDFEDGLVIACAERHGIDVIVTRNQKDFLSDRIRIMSPGEFAEAALEDGRAKGKGSKGREKDSEGESEM